MAGKKKSGLREHHLVSGLSKEFQIKRSTDGLRYYPRYAVPVLEKEFENQKYSWLYYYDEEKDSVVYFSELKAAEDWLRINYSLKDQY